jgi:predicted CXXCH cytochrome family protein
MDRSLLFFVLLPFISILGYYNHSIVEERRDSNSGLNYIQSPAQDPKCTDCHSDLLESKLLHGPATESCENCHTVNIKEHTENGARGLNLVKNIPDLCFKCHTEVKTDLDASPNVHESMKIENSCTTCHSPHSSDEKKLLVSQQKKLCLSCHNKDVTSKGEKTINIKSLLAIAKVIHLPVENGCVVCHQPHGSSNNYLLISSFPKGNYAPAAKDTFALCWECHDSDLLELAKTDAATNFRDGDRNLHYVHMNGKKSRSCVICHNVHASANEHLIEDKVKFGAWELPIRYTPAENGGSCFPGCHAEKKYTR